jgi:hypothetical protein
MPSSPITSLRRVVAATIPFNPGDVTGMAKILQIQANIRRKAPPTEKTKQQETCRRSPAIAFCVEAHARVNCQRS